MAGRHRTIDRVAAILEYAAADAEQGISLASVTERLEAPKSSLHGLLGGLLNVGYLVERGGRYFIGPGLNVLLGTAEQNGLGEIARDELAWLNQESEETVLLGILVGDSVVHTHQIESPHAIRYAAATNERRPILTTSIGKLFLADMDEKQVRRIARHQHSDPPVDVGELLEELGRVRERGYSTNYLTMQSGITALGAGIRDGQGQLVAAIAVRGPTFRMRDRVDRCAQLLLHAAGRVSALLGATP